MAQAIQAAQLAVARAGGPMPIIGAHSVGGLDGGPGVPITGWSVEHGDLRLPHFIGLHAVQILLLAAIGLRRRSRPQSVRVRFVIAVAASYFALFLLLIWHAMRGQSIVSPDATAVATLGVWAATTAVGLFWIARTSRDRPKPAGRPA